MVKLKSTDTEKEAFEKILSGTTAIACQNKRRQMFKIFKNV